LPNPLILSALEARLAAELNPKKRKKKPNERNNTALKLGYLQILLIFNLDYLINC
jgi:hypothetical protein